MKETLESLSKTSYRPAFRQQFRDLETQVQEAVAEAINDLVTHYRTHPWDHPHVKFIPNQGDIWRLKVGQRGQTVDHRVFFDIDDSGLIFLAVYHRDDAYTA
jgi:mRNA-degrading endonuclease RelE of RelBE toxin-antitoxin system